MIGKTFVILNRILETLEKYFNDKNEKVNSDGMNESSDWWTRVTKSIISQTNYILVKTIDIFPSKKKFSRH